MKKLFFILAVSIMAMISIEMKAQSSSGTLDFHDRVFMVINLGAGDIVKCPFFEGNTCRVTVTINQAGEIFIRVSDPSTSDSRTKIIPPNTQGYGNDPQIIIQQVSGELFGNGLEVE